MGNQHFFFPSNCPEPVMAPMIFRYTPRRTPVLSTKVFKETVYELVPVVVSSHGYLGAPPPTRRTAEAVG